MQVSDEMIRAAIDAATQAVWTGPEDQPAQEYIMRAALTAALALSGWRTIDSAQKDGRDLLCYSDGLGMGQMVLYWSDGRWREKANGMGLKREPTHWKPLDAPPATQDGKNE